ncbi:MAG: transcriptional regulator [Aliidiomarina sp.]|uniref:winged helix-turn-helix domain-containing protein n=1 Tax=Aliidiomarina sp. TaxID=1872439 RepID=UPI0025BABF64|nr:transcriptional regulator [Aliidiomarina sp.]MCH8500759.1 transcriptional regulator [Aliidiomarina sp.]
MTPDVIEFSNFSIHPTERLLLKQSQPVELTSRYFDALLLLVSEPGTLISKERFLHEVWGGIAVTDEALTQCIRTLRKVLGDSARQSQFIETVPKHGYRFIAPVRRKSRATEAVVTPQLSHFHQIVTLGGFGTLGAGMAGVIGGTLLAALTLSHAALTQFGAASIMFVMIAITVLVALLGGAGVAFATAAGDVFAKQHLAVGRRWSFVVFSAACGGLLIGAFVKLAAVDTFHLLLGASPGDITGAVEGFVIGGAVGLAYVMTTHNNQRRLLLTASVIGAAAATSIVASGGQLLAGSLNLVAENVPASNLPKPFFSTQLELLSAVVEGSLFVTAVVVALQLARQRLNPSH